MEEIVYQLEHTKLFLKEFSYTSLIVGSLVSCILVMMMSWFYQITTPFYRQNKPHMTYLLTVTLLFSSLYSLAAAHVMLLIIIAGVFSFLPLIRRPVSLGDQIVVVSGALIGVLNSIGFYFLSILFVLAIMAAMVISVAARKNKEYAAEKKLEIKGPEFAVNQMEIESLLKQENIAYQFLSWDIEGMGAKTKMVYDIQVSQKREQKMIQELANQFPWASIRVGKGDAGV